jgi:hypothetical protein
MGLSNNKMISTLQRLSKYSGLHNEMTTSFLEFPHCVTGFLKKHRNAYKILILGGVVSYGSWTFHYTYFLFDFENDLKLLSKFRECSE